MKKLLRCHLLNFIFLVGSVNLVLAQAANTYVYSYTTPTYTAITGTSLVSGAGSWDAGMVFTDVPIGFTFYFEGQPYTTVGVSSNGFIWFGSGTASTTEYNPISDPTLGTGTITGVVAGYGTQLEAFNTANLTSSPTGAPEISYTTAGSPCSEVFTVQWKGAFAASDPGSQSGFLGDLERIDMQIVLDQTTNKIGILLHVNPYPFLGSSSAEVGIRGASNTDFTSLTCWTNGCSQTTNNAAMGTLDPSYPATKSEFGFTPPACSYTAPTVSTDPTCGSNGSISITPTPSGSYTYIINNGTVADTNTTGSFTGLAAGTYITAVTNGSCAVTGCASLTSSVTTPTASNTGPVCVGGTVTLQTAAVTNATYSWTGPNGFTSSEQDPIITDITAADSGTYTIIDTVGGCASGPGTTKVVINGIPATPKVGNNSPVCAGTTLTLTDSTTATTYSWTGPNSFTSTMQDPTIANTVMSDSGTYTIINTVSGCASAPATIHVVISSALPAPKVGSNSPLCSGATLILTDSTSGATYGWTGPNSFTSTLQNPTRSSVVAADSGIYSVTDTISGCVSAAATVHVVISSILPAPQIGSNSPLCTGATLNLTNSTTGATYGWTGPNGFTSNLQNPARNNIVAADTGIYTAVDTVAGCVSLPATLDVAISSALPAPKVGSNSPLCIGATLTLTDSTSGATYNWTGPNSFASALQNPARSNVVVADSGTYIVTDTLSGCVSLPATLHVTINPIPATPKVGNNSPICVGASLILTDSTGGVAYSWTGPNSFISSLETPIISSVVLADSGTYTVINTVSGCNSSPVTTHVVINPIPSAPVATNMGPYCAGDTIKLNATPVANATYNWTGPNNFTNQQNPVKPNSATSDSGTYSVIATVNGCNSALATTTVVVKATPSTPFASNSGPYCVGNTLQLSASGDNGATYNWTGPNDFADQANPEKANVSLADSGVYTVIATIGSCSSSPAITDVIIAPPPSSPHPSSNSPVCQGGTLDLMASFINGATYNWTGPNNFTNQQNPSKPNTTFADSGVYVVVATIGTCSSTPDSVTVKIIPAPTLLGAFSNSPVCSGDTLKLTTPLVNGVTYNWTGPDTFSSNEQNVSIAGALTSDSGLYILSITLGNCTSVPDSFHVIVNAAPVPPTPTASNDTICASDSSQLCVPFTFDNYQWNTVVQGYPGDTTQCIYVYNAGSYYVTVTDNNGCTATSGSVAINVYPVSSVSIIVQGDTLSSFGAVAYQWIFNDTAITGATSDVYIATKTGNYSVQITDANGCKNTSSSTYVVVNPLGISEIISIQDLEIYPNPVSSVLNIRYTGASGKNCILALFDILGDKVIEEPLYFNSAGNKTLDVSYLPKGMYLLQLQTGDQAVTQKIVIQ